MKQSERLLNVQNIAKSFGGVIALSGVSIDISAGTIFGLIGPNGAGKTTLFNILTGIYEPDSGEFELCGRSLVGKKPHRIVEAGLARTFQNIRLFRNMTALENVMVGCHGKTKAGALGAIFRDRKTVLEEAFIKDKARELLDYVGILRFGESVSNTLSYGDQRRLEIARALATAPKLLALDEPAAGMNATETLALRELLTKIRNDGTTILLIEHDVKLVMGLCDRVAVLDFGQKISEGVPREVQKDRKVITAYLGGGLP